MSEQEKHKKKKEQVTVRSFSTTGRSRSDSGNTKYERRIFSDERQTGAIHF